MNRPSQKKAIIIASIITGLNVLVSCGFSIAGVISPQSLLPAYIIPSEASFISAMYVAARAIPIAGITLLVIYKRSVSSLLFLGLLAGIMQLLDAGVGVYLHDMVKVFGPLGLALLQFYSLLILSKAAIVE